MINLQREVWEGWTVQDFINAVSEGIHIIMTGQSLEQPFKTKEEMIAYMV